MNKPKQVYFANEWFTLPFSATGNWVEDSKGKNVLEARNAELAKALAEMMNKSLDV